MESSFVEVYVSIVAKIELLVNLLWAFEKFNKYVN